MRPIHDECGLCAPFPDLSGIPPALASDRSAIVTAIQRGDFWKPCPGTGAGYHCCGYQVLTPMTGCAMYCAYCALQAYLACRCQVVFNNFGDLEREVREKMDRWRGVVRFGTGEFCDSLHQEPRLGLSRRIAALLRPYRNAVVEFKTKSAHVEELGDIEDPTRVVVGFSMNTPSMIKCLEQGTASLEERLAAARRCEEMGFWVAFHFDPIVWYPEWEKGYREVVARIFDTVRDTGRIAWWSMGGFRCVPELKRILRDRLGELPLFHGELILGDDRKYRYFRPLRVEFYRALSDEVWGRDVRVPLYLCMESPEVWEESGMAGRIRHGLARYLDARAGEMLGL